MKKLPLVLVALLIVVVSFSQTIKVHVTKAQRFMKWGQYDYLDVLENPESVEIKQKNIDCEYVFDLDNKTSIFTSKSANVQKIVLPIVDFKKTESGYVINYNSYGSIDSSFTYLVTVYIDLDSGNMFYTKYDPYMNRTFVTPCKSDITMETGINQ